VYFVKHYFLTLGIQTASAEADDGFIAGIDVLKFVLVIILTV